MQKIRAQFQAEIAKVPADDLIFLDESGVTTDMTRRFGRAAVGERVVDSAPGKWRTLTILGAISLDGWFATMTIEAPTDGDVFQEFLRQVLCPKLTPGRVVVMDNLRAHKVDGVRQLVESTGATLRYLPPYSPDFNPIEQCWAQLKQLLRAVKARTVAALEQAIAEVQRALTPTHATACFAHCGYASKASIR